MKHVYLSFCLIFSLNQIAAVNSIHPFNTKNNKKVHFYAQHGGKAFVKKLYAFAFGSALGIVTGSTCACADYVSRGVSIPFTWVATVLTRRFYAHEFLKETQRRNLALKAGTCSAWVSYGAIMVCLLRLVKK